MTKDEIEELSFKWTGVRSARNVDAETFVEACERGKSAQPVDADTFIKACEENDVNFVSDALKTDNSLSNAASTGRYGNFALMIASSKGYTEIVKLLIDNGADVNKRSCIGSTALYSALDSEEWGVIKNQSLKIVALLINAGADVNVKDVQGSTPLSIAAARGYYDIVQLLLENGANANERGHGPFGSTALDMAEMGGHKNIMNLLRAYGAEG
ncbi:MAG: ankyrin repeat domain-containing protein [Treponema sp.]|nr:ankyrin repeat domain-containing protein [Treponema sp.]